MLEGAKYRSIGLMPQYERGASLLPNSFVFFLALAIGIKIKVIYSWIA
jgi:hypothetical protein